MKILVIRTGAVGDTILLSPVLQNLRAARPGAARPGVEIHVLGHPERVPLLLGPPNADLVFSSEDSRWLEFHKRDGPNEDARGWLGEYDMVLSYSMREDGTVERNLRGILGGRFVHSPALPPDGYSRHYVEFLLEPLARLGYPVRVMDPVIHVPEGSPNEHSPAPPRIVVHPGAGSAKKRWPLECFLGVAAGLERTKVIECRFLLGPADMDLREVLEQQGIEPLDSVSLDELVDLLRGASGYIGNDSGISHLAAALRIPTIAVFTVTDPVVWRPLGPRVRVIDVRRGVSNDAAIREARDYLAEGIGQGPYS